MTSAAAINALKVKNLMLIGQCISHNMPIINAARVRCQLLEFNSYLKMYFPMDVYFFTHDPEQLCKDGDIVLIKKLEEPLTKHISHNLIKNLYPLGDVTDPISGEKCVGEIYRKTLHLEKEMYGKADDATGGFDYDSAPPRGWQEGKKDLTDKPTYRKYHEFEPSHPLHNDPAAW